MNMFKRVYSYYQLQYRGAINAIDLSEWLHEFKYIMPNGKNFREDKSKVPKLEGYSASEPTPSASQPSSCEIPEEVAGDGRCKSNSDSHGKEDPVFVADEL